MVAAYVGIDGSEITACKCHADEMVHALVFQGVDWARTKTA
jgi:hypothetical protein